MNNTSDFTKECGICREECSDLYSCCPIETDRFCEACWLQTVSNIIKRGKVGVLLAGNLDCDFCQKPIKAKLLSKEIQNQIDKILLTIPKTKNPQSIEEFNYSYNDSLQLRNRLTDEKFIFISQHHYSLLGACIDKYIQSLMKSNPWDYEEIWLPHKDEDTDDHHDQVNIFTSNNFKTNENGCLVLIQGSGVVRPGQWARSCCINESLDIGSMFPYMNEAKKNNLSVIILNPNQTSYVKKASPVEPDANVNKSEETVSNQNEIIPIKEEYTSTENTIPVDMEVDSVVDAAKNKNEEDSSNDDIISFYVHPDPLPSSPKTKIPNLSTSREHILYVYDNVISNCPAKQLYIVAHSAGGDGLMYLLRKRQDQILKNIAKIAFTDSVHSLLPCESNEIRNFLKSNAIHFVASDEPMGTPIDYAYDFSEPLACQEVSAGHPKHEYTSGYCVKGVFDFFFPPPSTTEDGIDRTKL